MMKMTGMPRGRKALIISAVIHCILLISVGFCLGQNVKPPEPALIEVGLADSAQLPGVSGGGSSAPKKSGQKAAKTKQMQAKHAPVKSSVAVTQEVVPDDASVDSEYEETAGDDAPSGEAGQAGEGDGDGGTGGGNAADGGNGNGNGNGNGSGSGDGDGGGGISPPVILSNPEPKYPQLARKSGIEGTVHVRLQVLENGSVGDAGVVASSGTAALDQAAVDAAMRWRFAPAKNLRTGQAIACYTRVPIVFHLK